MSGEGDFVVTSYEESKSDSTMDEGKNFNLFMSFPIEILEEVLSKLSKKELLKCRLVSSEWNEESSRCLRSKFLTTHLSEKYLKSIEKRTHSLPFPFSKFYYYYGGPVEEKVGIDLSYFCEKYGKNIKCLNIRSPYFINPEVTTSSEQICPFMLLLKFATQIKILVIDGGSCITSYHYFPDVSYYFPPSIKFNTLKILKISLFVNYYEEANWNQQIFSKIVERAQFLREIHLMPMLLVSVDIFENFEKCSKFKELVKTITGSSASVFKLHLKNAVNPEALLHYIENPEFTYRIQEIKLCGTYYANIISNFTPDWEEAFPNVSSLFSYGTGSHFQNEGIYYFKNVKILELHGLKQSVWNSFTGGANETDFLDFIKNTQKFECEKEASDFISKASENMKGLGELKRLEKLCLSFFNGDVVESSINSLIYLAHFTKIKPLELLSLKYDRKYFSDFDTKETSQFLQLLSSYHKNLIIDSETMMPEDLYGLLDGESY